MENQKKNLFQFFYQHKNKINYKRKNYYFYLILEKIKFFFFSKYNINKVIYYEQILFDKINIMCDENYLYS